MDRLTCDRCGDGLLLTGNVRYEVTIEVKSAYDPMEITREDLAADLDREMGLLLEDLEGITEAQAMDQVYRTFRFDLCGRCQAAYVKEPLARSAPPKKPSDP